MRKSLPVRSAEEDYLEHEEMRQDLPPVHLQDLDAYFETERKATEQRTIKRQKLYDRKLT